MRHRSVILLVLALVIALAALVSGCSASISEKPSGESTSTPSESTATTTTATSTAPTKPVVTAPPKKTYKKLSSRKFKMLAKDPDSYINKYYYIYGQITQFDAATGVDTFRADVGPKKLAKSYGYVDYPQNALLTGDEDRLKKFVEGDLFLAKVTCMGSFSYDTQAGGNTTVPSFQVDSIKRIGTAK